MSKKKRKNNSDKKMCGHLGKSEYKSDGFIDLLKSTVGICWMWQAEKFQTKDTILKLN